MTFLFILGIIAAYFGLGFVISALMTPVIASAYTAKGVGQEWSRLDSDGDVYERIILPVGTEPKSNSGYYSGKWRADGQANLLDQTQLRFGLNITRFFWWVAVPVYLGMCLNNRALVKYDTNRANLDQIAANKELAELQERIAVLEKADDVYRETGQVL